MGYRKKIKEIHKFHTKTKKRAILDRRTNIPHLNLDLRPFCMNGLEHEVDTNGSAVVLIKKITSIASDDTRFTTVNVADAERLDHAR